jgi:hypothetical protein
VNVHWQYDESLLKWHLGGIWVAFGALHLIVKARTVNVEMNFLVSLIENSLHLITVMGRSTDSQLEAVTHVKELLSSLPAVYHSMWSPSSSSHGRWKAFM